MVRQYKLKFSKLTTVSYYDNPKSFGATEHFKVARISPKEYLIEVSKMNLGKMSKKERLRIGNPKTKQSLLNFQMKNMSKYKLARIRKGVHKGVKFPMPYINFADKSQEGRHRAIYAMKRGIKKIPVMVITK